MSSLSLVVSFLTTLLLAAALCAYGEQVYDSTGQPLKIHQEYYIQPVKTRDGLIPYAFNTNCPLGITQTYSRGEPGIPVTFSHPYLIMDPNITTTIDVNIVFTRTFAMCEEDSKYWEVDVPLSSSLEPAILIDGKRRAPNSWFKIVKAEEGENTYKLTSLHGPVGVKPRSELKAAKLVVTNVNSMTLLVRFNKVDDATSRVEKLDRIRMFPFY